MGTSGIGPRLVAAMAGVIAALIATASVGLAEVPGPTHARTPAAAARGSGVNPRRAGPSAAVRTGPASTTPTTRPAPTPTTVAVTRPQAPPTVATTPPPAPSTSPPTEPGVSPAPPGPPPAPSTLLTPPVSVVPGPAVTACPATSQLANISGMTVAVCTGSTISVLPIGPPGSIWQPLISSDPSVLWLTSPGTQNCSSASDCPTFTARSPGTATISSTLVSCPGACPGVPAQFSMTVVVKP